MRGSAPLVSVVIPTYERAALVVEAARSALAQTFRDLEVIVCDDGSADDTRARVEALGPPVRYVSLPHSGRPGAVRNRGVAASRGRLVAFLDADDLWEPEKLARQVERLTREPSVEVVYCDRWVLHADGSRSGPVLTGKQKRCEDLLALSLGGHFAQLSSTLFRKELLEDVGGFDEALVTGEDFDLWLRLPAGTRAACVGEPLALIRRSPDSLGDASGDLAFTNAIDVLERRLRAGGLGPAHRRRALATLSRLHLELAAALGAAGDRTGARREARAALELTPARPRAWVRAAKLWLPG